MFVCGSWFTVMTIGSRHYCWHALVAFWAEFHSGITNCWEKIDNWWQAYESGEFVDLYWDNMVKDNIKIGCLCRRIRKEIASMMIV